MFDAMQTQSAEEDIELFLKDCQVQSIMFHISKWICKSFDNSFAIANLQKQLILWASQLLCLYMLETLCSQEGGLVMANSIFSHRLQ